MGGQTPTRTSVGRILGILDADSGTPVEGAEVIDRIANKSAITTRSGLVGLAAFTDKQDSIVITIRKIGYVDTTFLVFKSDTAPITLMLEQAAPVLPTMLTAAIANRNFNFAGGRDFADLLSDKASNPHPIFPDSMRKLDGQRLKDALPMLNNDPICKRYVVFVNGFPSPIDLQEIMNSLADRFSAALIYRGYDTPIRFGTKCVLVIWERG
jgi:hypothetical protein